ncbi:MULTISPECIES: hypothetical protein [unclassified Haladaptatus]|uniref:DUF7116 family protein n=1 Tax=unclassified Haladaptatus TaxID=2622732 RepID=UPI0023E8BC37|nr:MULTISPECIES: hypothetical protein [unclassified Haladaptatus]
MGPVNTPPVEEARSIFTTLGYTVSGSGTEFTAERKWRTVNVTATDGEGRLPSSGTLRCFVTWRQRADPLRRRLLEEKPDYDWAIISVDADDDYEVIHPVVGPAPVA